jgi:S-layer family protein
MKSRVSTVVVPLAFFGICSSAGAFAQAASPAPQLPQGGESYGSGANYLVIPSAAFVPAGSFSYAIDATGYLTTSAFEGVFRAPVELPAGASVVNVCAFTLDNSATYPAEVSWEGIEAGDASAPPKLVPLGTGMTDPAGTPGYGLTCVDLSSPTLIRKFQDLDGDGKSHDTQYEVTGAIFAGTAFGGAVITWLRTVSPAPATATFGDVPTNFVYFRAIEALAASGITGGCGNGNFCPNQNVTRGEMAAFLARALGLHWPY